MESMLHCLAVDICIWVPIICLCVLRPCLSVLFCFVLTVDIHQAWFCHSVFSGALWLIYLCILAILFSCPPNLSRIFTLLCSLHFSLLNHSPKSRMWKQGVMIKRSPFPTVKKGQGNSSSACWMCESKELHSETCLQHISKLEFEVVWISTEQQTNRGNRQRQNQSTAYSF